MRSIYLVIPLLFIIASCNKNRDNIIDITGNVKNAINNQSAAGVQVKLEVKDLGGNSFSNSFSEIETTITDLYGEYEFSFENRNAIEYRLIYSSDNYFSQTISINPDDLDLAELNVYDQEVFSSSYIIVNINNSTPFNSSDQFTLNFNEMVAENPGPGSCLTNIISLTGNVADTTFECQLYGDQTVNYEYFVTKNNITTQYNGGVYCPPGDTANSYINY